MPVCGKAVDRIRAVDDDGGSDSGSVGYRENGTVVGRLKVDADATTACCEPDGALQDEQQAGKNDCECKQAH